MLNAGKGLTEISTKELKRALASLHRKEITCPLSIQELTRIGLQYCAGEFLDVLRGVDEKGVRAVLIAVIAERIANE